jgi:hypothetical protein
MALSQNIIAASDAIRDSFLVVPPNAQPGTQPRLRWAGFKRNDPGAFWDAVFKLFANHTGDIYWTGTDGSDLDYGGWFNYFYREALGVSAAIKGEDVSRIVGAKQANFARIFSTVFEVRVTGAGNNMLTLAGPLPVNAKVSFRAALTSQPGGVPRDILQYLFEEGFQQANTTDAANYFSTNLALASNLPNGAGIRSQKGEYVFGYRGDTRDPQTVKQHKGAKCRAELAFWRQDAHVDASWHPWQGHNSPSQQMWFRKGAKDNDYFTLNSMAKDFHIACAYPMFRSFQIDQSLVGPMSGWNQAKRQLLANKSKLWGNVKIVNVLNRKSGQMEEVPSDDGCIYVCTLTGTTTVARTWELNSYPESGIRNVGLEDMLAYVKIKRYHRPPDSDDQPYDSTHVTPSMTIKILSWAWVRTEEEARATLGCTKDGMKPIIAKLNNLVGTRFDISHTSLCAGSTYDPDAKAPPVQPQQAKPKPFRSH